MNTPVSLRSAKTERRYQRAKKQGIPKPIDQINGKRFYTLKNLYNDYELDMAFETSDMLLARRKGLLGFVHWWVVLGYIYYTNKHDGYDQLIFNFKHTQSQPQIPHCHRTKFKSDRKDFTLWPALNHPASATALNNINYVLHNTQQKNWGVMTRQTINQTSKTILRNEKWATS